MAISQKCANPKCSIIIDARWPVSLCTACQREKAEKAKPVAAEIRKVLGGMK